MKNLRPILGRLEQLVLRVRRKETTVATLELQDETLDASHGPTRLLLAVEYWKNAANEARIERDELRWEKEIGRLCLDVFDEFDTCDAFCGLPAEYLTQNAKAQATGAAVCARSPAATGLASAG